jgi:phospholipid/cholesterol/gamma-HCH transport system substrate-binding protein
MKRTDRVKWSELKVGLLVAFGLFFLLWASFSGGGTSIFYPKFELNTVLRTSNGLVKGAPVRLSGVEVGKVGEIALVGLTTDQQVRVQLMIEQRAWHLVKKDSRATLGTIGMLGDKYIEVTPGTLELPELSPGDTIPGHVAGDLLTIIDKAPDMLGNLQDLSSALGRLARHLEGEQGTVGKLLYSDSLYQSLMSASSEAGDLLATFNSELPKVSAQLRTSLERLDRLADKAEDTTGTLGLVLGSRTLYDRINRASATLDTLMGGLRSGEGTAGALLRDPDLYVDLHKTVLDLQALLVDMRENPKKYVTFKIF